MKDLKPIPNSVALHHACHARAQNMGFKSRDMLNLIPDIHLSSIERCSGHGGSFGVMKETHQTALNVGKPVFARVQKERQSDPSKLPPEAKISRRHRCFFRLPLGRGPHQAGKWRSLGSPPEGCPQPISGGRSTNHPPHRDFRNVLRAKNRIGRFN